MPDLLPPLTADERAELARLAEMATPGPWFLVYTDDADHMNAVYVGTVNRGADHDGERGMDGSRLDEVIAATLIQAPRLVGAIDGRWDEDAAFIAAARTALPRLLADLARLTEERDEHLGFSRRYHYEAAKMTEERDTARAESARLAADLTEARTALADQQRAFVAGVEAQYRHSDAERDRLAVELGEARAAGQRVAEAGTALLRIVDRDTVAVRDLRAAIAALAGGAR